MTRLPATPVHEPARLRAPRADAELLSHPPLVQGVSQAQANAAQLSTSPVVMYGRPLEGFRQWARQECLETARRWLSRTLGIESSPADAGALFVTGHQPQLNHAGVWMKNFAVARLAECCGGTGLNLIVDNDLAGPPVVRCPAGSRQEPRFTDVPFDTLHETQPWEELHVQNRELFTTFADRIEAELSAWGIQPVLSQQWPEVVQTLQRTDQLAVILSSWRILQERQWQARNFELPVSEMCRTEPFLAFVVHLCQNFEQFFAEYNRAVHTYRVQYRVRNHRHPVPDLEQHQDRYELPFWYWKPGDHDRTQVFVRRSETSIELFAGDRFLTRLSADSCDIAPLQDLQQTGRLRTRALTTTLFARLCLGDLFIHGIGGARYDEITDAIIQSFFQTPVPAFATLTATLHLPLMPYAETSADVSHLKNKLRQLQFSGAAKSSNSEVAALRMRRAELLHAAQIERTAGASKAERRDRRGEHRRRHLELTAIQQRLAELAAPAVAATRQHLESSQQAVHANRVLQSRDFAACLFPAEKLQTLVSNLRRQICGRA